MLKVVASMPGRVASACGCGSEWPPNRHAIFSSTFGVYSPSERPQVGLSYALQSLLRADICGTRPLRLWMWLANVSPPESNRKRVSVRFEIVGADRLAAARCRPPGGVSHPKGSVRADNRLRSGPPLQFETDRCVRIWYAGTTHVATRTRTSRRARSGFAMSLIEGAV